MGITLIRHKTRFGDDWERETETDTVREGDLGKAADGVAGGGVQWSPIWASSSARCGRLGGGGSSASHDQTLAVDGTCK